MGRGLGLIPVLFREQAVQQAVVEANPEQVVAQPEMVVTPQKVLAELVVLFALSSLMVRANPEAALAAGAVAPRCGTAAVKQEEGEGEEPKSLKAF